jgi:hypothetical protein
MPSMKRIVSFVLIFGSDEQVRAADPGVHSAHIISSDHGLDPRFVQNPLGNLSVCRGPECRDGD